MTSVKARPSNGPGSNGLRGGIKQYVPKTINGHWLEAVGGPSGYRRGFTTIDYETTSQNQQLGAGLARAPEFGPELPDENTRNVPSSPFTSTRKEKDFDNENNPLTSPWMTNTKLMGLSVMNRDRKKESETSLKSHLPPTTLETYRRTWTTDPDYLRYRRFLTETRIASSTSAGPLFTVKSVRLLPGTPKPLELLREQLLARYGLLTFLVLTTNLLTQQGGGRGGDEGGAEEITANAFRNWMVKMGGELKLYQMNQIISFVTATDTISLTKFYNILKGNVLGYHPALGNELYRKMLAYVGRDSSQGQLVSWEEMIACMNDNEHYEIVASFQEGKDVQVVGIYVRNPEGVTLEEFHSLLQEMYATSPETFELTMKSLWKV